MKQAGLDLKYWEYALDHVGYVKNRLPHSGISSSPLEKRTGSNSTLQHARVFGYSSSKVHVKADKGIFLGCNDHGVHMAERLSDGKLLNSVHVTFDATSFPGLYKTKSSSLGECSSGSAS